MPQQSITVSQPLRGKQLWAGWTLATAAGELIGFAIPAAVGATVVAVGIADGPRFPLLVAAGVAEGAILGLAQWLVLRQPFPKFLCAPGCQSPLQPQG